MEYDAIIVGAGPGGLRCGELLARSGLRVLIIEKNCTIGKKVCAGGITWKGLIERIPAGLIERSFDTQIVTTPWQRIRVQAPHPIIATVNRIRLGEMMAETARSSGAHLLIDARLTGITHQEIQFVHNGHSRTASYRNLIGADGTTSLVRRYLGLGVDYFGIGINYSLQKTCQQMQWHFEAKSFGSGYAWIFPHSNTISTGAYSADPACNPTHLNQALVSWLKAKNIDVTKTRLRAEKIACDYQGWKFDNIYLVGDAAGLASPLTGEGIYPAMVSAEAVASSIIEAGDSHDQLRKLIKKHRIHAQMQRLASKHTALASLLSESSALLLRFGLISFNTFEMA